MRTNSPASMPPPCFSAWKNPLDRTRRCPCSSRCVGCHPAFDTRHDHAQRSSVRIWLTVVLLRFPVGLAYCSSECVQLKIRTSMNFVVVQASEQCSRQVQVGAGHHRKKRSVERVPCFVGLIGLLVIPQPWSSSSVFSNSFFALLSRAPKVVFVGNRHVPIRRTLHSFRGLMPPALLSGPKECWSEPKSTRSVCSGLNPAGRRSWLPHIHANRTAVLRNRRRTADPLARLIPRPD